MCSHLCPVSETGLIWVFPRTAESSLAAQTVYLRVRGSHGCATVGRRKYSPSHLASLPLMALFTGLCPWAGLFSVSSAGTEPQKAGTGEEHCCLTWQSGAVPFWPDSGHGGQELCHSGPPDVENKLLLSGMLPSFPEHPSSLCRGFSWLNQALPRLTGLAWV